MGWLAYLQALPPLLWGAAVFSGFILVAIARLISSTTKKREAEAALLQATAATPSPFNRLETQFYRKQIRVADLIHPLGQPLQGKVFVECEFFGPGIIAASACGFNGRAGAGNLELIRLSADTPHLVIPNKAMLVQCQFNSCSFYNLVLAMTTESVNALHTADPAIPILGER